MKNYSPLRGALMLGASLVTLSAAHAQSASSGGSPTYAQSAVPEGLVPETDEQIVANHTVTPGPGNPATGANFANSPQVLDPAGQINGVGQMIGFFQSSPTGAGLGLCSGTLINPRTVITASHCVYNSPAHVYGSQTGTSGGVNGNFGAITSIVGNTVTRAPLTSQGVPLSFGFSSTNRCLGITPGVNAGAGAVATAGNGCQAETGAYEKWRNSGFRTNVEAAIYNANQVFYLTGMQPVALGGGGEFANSDVALVTLDTHVQDIPTWTLLFSPLDGPAHATITGYGANGVGLSGIGSLAGIDYRRRSAENMIDALFTNNDWVDSPAINPGNTAFAAHQHSIYWLDFDDPNFSVAGALANPRFFSPTPGVRNNGYYDFNGLGGTALPLEGATAGGDSGGPLLVDQRWDKSVIAATLTGSFSFNGGISTYGQFNVYSPLFAVWQDIVRNNPYVYASARAGNGDWFDPAHWLQDMDPNYAIIGANGELLTGVPDTPQGGADGAVDKFGTLCFLGEDCKTFDGPGAPNGNGTPAFTLGGPGSTNFVPNNVNPVNSATAGQTIKARYYDVTLNQPGTTTLFNRDATIDRLSLDGSAKLVINAASLNVLSDFTQGSGWTQVDGYLKTGEALVIKGIVSGVGVFDPTYLTVVAGVVAPGGDKIGTLTIAGDTILASASALFIDAQRGGADQLVLTDGMLALNNPTLVISRPITGPAPRHGEYYYIAYAEGGINGTFGSVFSFQGVLRPEIEYYPKQIVLQLRAGSLATQLGQSTASARAFASALDTLRTSSYTSLWNLYGAVDLMDPAQLGATLDSLAPRVLGESGLLQDRQSRMLMANVTDRLSLAGTGAARGMAVIGDTRGFAQSVSGAQAGPQAFAGLAPAGTLAGTLPEGVTGFIAAGTTTGESSYGSSARLGGGRSGSWMGMGLEFRAGDRTTLGTATGFASATSRPGSDRVDSRTLQAAAYATRELGGGAYLGAVANMESAHLDADRTGYGGAGLLELTGATDMRRIGMMAEAGKAFTLGGGLSLTPRVRLGYDRQVLAGFSERGGETALAVDSLTRERIEAKLGFALAGSTGLGNGWRLAPQLQADVSRRLAGTGGTVTVRFANAPEAGIALPLAGSARTWAEARAALSLDNGVVAFSAGGETAFGAGYRDDRVLAGVTVRY